MKTTGVSKFLDEFASRVSSLPAPYPRFVVFVSATEGDRRARVRTITASSLDELREGLQEKGPLQMLGARHLRLDWVTSVQAVSFATYKAAMQKVKRNYSRKGLSLDADFQHAITEGELNGSALLYQGAQSRIAKSTSTTSGSIGKGVLAKSLKPPKILTPSISSQLMGCFVIATAAKLSASNLPGRMVADAFSTSCSLPISIFS